MGGVYSIWWRRTQRKRREEEEAGAKKRKKIYEPGDVSQVLCSLGFFSVDGWLEKERKKGAAGPGGYPAKKKRGKGEGAGFFL